MAGSISTLGVGSGLELQNILDQLREVDQSVVDLSKVKVADLEVQLEEFTTVKNQLLDLKSTALTLSLSSSFLGRTVSSSDEKIIEAAVTDGATVKSTSLEVVKLAEQSSWLSAGFSSTSDPATNADSQLSYAVGDETITLEVTAGTTLQQLADEINDDTDNPGVIASIIDTGEPGTPHKLLLRAEVFGDDGKIDILSVPDLMIMNRQQDGVSTLDATFKVDGITYQRPENTINDVISGVTLTLKATTADNTSVGITVGNNQDAQEELINALVDNYNTVVQELRANSSYDSETEEFGNLSGTTLRDLPYELQGLISSFSYADATKEIQSLFDLGMEFDRSGNLVVDSDVLTAALSENGDKVRAFFLGDSDKDIEGFADKINSRLRTITSSVGVVEAEKTAAQTRIDDLDLHIEDETARLDKKYEQLTQQFIALDSFMNEMTSMSNFLTGQFDSLSNAWGGGSSKQ